MEIEELQEAANYIKSQFDDPSVFDNSVAVVLGSGLGDFTAILSEPKVIDYDHIPHMPRVTVQSHHGQLICGRIPSESSTSPLILCFSGRVHSYEGIPWQHVCFQVRLLATLGVKLYIVTNATGGMLDGMVPGCLCLLTDHFRFMARKDPLSDFDLPQEVIENSKTGKYYWDDKINAITREAAKDLNIRLFEGSYVWTSGPSFETPLEVEVAKKLGGAVVGMSTVPEVITAHSYGMSVLGISMVTNLAAGLSTTDLNHEEVYTNANNSILYLKNLLKRVLNSIDDYLVTHTKVAVKDTTFKPVVRRQFPDSGDSLKNALNDTCDRIVESLGEAAANAYIVCSSTVTGQDGKSLELIDLPQFPVNSSGGNNGRIVVVNGNELCIVCGDEEGFTIEESAFIALILYKLGVQSVSTTLQGTAIHENDKSDKVTPLQDVFQFHDPVAPIHPYLTYLNDGSFNNQFLFPYKNDNYKSYMSFCGPSYPSNGEFQVADQFKQSFVGTTSVSTIYALRYLGIHVHAFVNQQRQSDLASLVGQIAITKSESPVVQRALKFDQLSNLINQVNKLHIQYNENISYDKLDQLATKIRTDLKNVPSVAILDYDFHLEELLINNRDVKLITNVDVATNHIGQDAVLHVLEYNGIQFFMLSTKLILDHSKQEEMKLDWSDYVRLFQHLHVKHVVFTQCFVSIASDQIQLGNVIEVADHANFTGSNPMIGPNNDKYGPRFFDMSHVYSLISNNNNAEHVAKVRCVQLPMVHTCRSLSEFKVVRDVFGGNVVASQGAKESILTQHCSLVANFKCSMLGVVDELVDLEHIQFKQQKVTQDSKLKLADILLTNTLLK